MHKIFYLSVFFFLFPSHVFSEWNVIAENEEAKIFVDPGSIRKVDKGVKSIWALKNFKKDNRKINSRQFKLEFDCENDEFRRMIRVSFSGHFSSGLPIKDYFKPEDWRSIDDDELFKALFQKTCKKIN